MLAQRIHDYTPPQPALATLRRQLADALSPCPCRATQQRVLLAVNEVIANIVRHAAPSATDISVDFVDQDDRLYCVIMDDGGAFDAFRDYWRKAAQSNEQKDMFLHGRMGLKIVYRLWPEAFYVPRCEAFPYNCFFLPLTKEGAASLPVFFKPTEQTEWPLVLRSLLKGVAA